MTHFKTLQEAIDRFRLVHWGLAPKDSLKGNKGYEIEKLLEQVWQSSHHATLEKCVEEIKWMKEEGRVGYPWIHDGTRMCERFDKLLASLSDYLQKIKEIK